MLTFAQGISIADILGPDEVAGDFTDDFLKSQMATPITVSLPPKQPADPLGQRCIQLFIKNQARHSLKKAYKREWKEVYCEDF